MGTSVVHENKKQLIISTYDYSSLPSFRNLQFSGSVMHYRMLAHCKRCVVTLTVLSALGSTECKYLECWDSEQECCDTEKALELLSLLCWIEEETQQSVCFALTLTPYNVSYLFTLKLDFQGLTALKASIFSRDTLYSVCTIKFFFLSFFFLLSL